MRAGKKNTQNENKGHDADLAAYLDKLLRSELASALQVQTPAVQQQPSPTASAEQRQDSTPDDKPTRARNPERKREPAVTRPKRWEEAPVAKRPKARAPRRTRVRTRSGREKPKGARQIVMTALIPVLAIVLLVLVRRPLNGPAAAKAEILDGAPPVATTNGEISVDWEIPPVYKATGPDPMGPILPQVQEEEPQAAPVQVYVNGDVKGVLYSEDRPAAIIGTRLVHEGEQIGGATVIAIEQDGVQFEKNGQRWKQTISGSPVVPGQETGESSQDGS